MPRPPRVHFPGALYHVIARGNGGQAIFRTEGDRQHLLASLEAVWRQYGFCLYAFVLMPNHLHLLVEVQEIPLAKLMQSLLYRHTRHFHRTYKTRGHLFEGRYRAILCDRDSYLLELVRYLHLNPVRAGLVATPERYRWSSHGAYLGEEHWPFLSSEVVLGQFADRMGRARIRYRRFVLEGTGQGARSDLYAVTDGRFLGDEAFVVEARRHSPRAREVSRPVAIGLQDLAAAVARQWGVSSASIPSPEKTRAAVQMKRVIALVAVEMGGYSQRQVADFMACDPASISAGMLQLRKEIGKDLALARQVHALRDEVRRGRSVKR